MPVEYVATRLRHSRSLFVSGDDIVSIAAGKDTVSVASILGGSVFRDEVNRMSARGGRKITPFSLSGAVSDGYLNLLEKTARMIGQVMPDFMETVFSRFELEQIKQILRNASTPGDGVEKRTRFLNLMPRGSGKLNPAEIKSVEKLKAILTEIKHPFAPALAGDIREKKTVQIEFDLERFYFQKYLPDRKSVLKKVWDYVVDQCDLVNLQTAVLMKSGGAKDNNMENFFVEGPGRITKKRFAELVSADDAGFAAEVEKTVGIKLKPVRSATKFSLVARRLFLRRWRRKRFEESPGLWEIFLFPEEVSAMAASLKLAILFGRSRIPYREAADYF
jgi:vacuolar-type H+-ATPase subunit C/Vma6